MHTRRLMEILSECLHQDADDYGVAVAVAAAVEADTREGLASVCDAAGLIEVAEAVRVRGTSVLEAIQSTVLGLSERHAELAESLGHPDVAAAIRGG
jgi:hypothetical protein